MQISVTEISAEVYDSVQKDILELDLEFFPYPWKEKAWKDLFSDIFGPKLYVLKRGEQLIGFTLFSYNKITQEAHLLKIVVDTKLRGLGHGASLLRKSLEYLGETASVFLEVHHENMSALNLYKSAGFKNLVLRKNFYGQGEHACAMQLVLD